MCFYFFRKVRNTIRGSLTPDNSPQTSHANPQTSVVMSKEVIPLELTKQVKGNFLEIS
jgi:hypothetical protein